MVLLIHPRLSLYGLALLGVLSFSWEAGARDPGPEEMRKVIYWSGLLGRPDDDIRGEALWRMTKLPDPGSHTVRYYGAYANRLRSAYRDDEGEVAVRTADAGAAPASRASWARLLHQVFEVDPLTCVRCGAEMRVISVITAPGLVDRLLRHVRGKNAADADPGGARDPPAA